MSPRAQNRQLSVLSWDWAPAGAQFPIDWASGANYIAARADDFQGCGEHLFLTVEGTAGTAQGAKVSLRMNLSVGLEGRRRFFLSLVEKARTVAR